MVCCTDRSSSNRHSTCPKWILIFILLLMLFCFSNAQIHFQPVQKTGKPYAIIIRNAIINGSTVVSGTEFAVFDDTLCVGASVYQDSFPVVLTAWEGNVAYGLKGFKKGDSIIFKIYTQGISGEWKEFDPDVLYEIGDGRFGTGAYTVVSLEFKEKQTHLDNRYHPEDFKVKVYPNPFNSRVNFDLKNLPGNRYVLTIYSLNSQEVFRLQGMKENYGHYIYSWHGQNNEGKILASGIYLFILRSGNYFQSGKIVFQK